MPTFVFVEFCEGDAVSIVDFPSAGVDHDCGEEGELIDISKDDSRNGVHAEHLQFFIFKLSE